MGCDEALDIHVRSLVTAGRVLDPKLKHSTIIAERQAFALDGDQLADLIFIIKAGKPDFHLDATSVVLNIQRAVNIPRFVRRCHLPLDHHIVFDVKR